MTALLSLVHQARCWCQQAGVHKWASELARLHEGRDKEIVEIQRYETVQGLVYQEQGANRFQVCQPRSCSTP